MNKLKSSTSNIENTSKEVQKSPMGARATDSARVMKFTKVLSGTTVILGIMQWGFLFFYLFTIFFPTLFHCFTCKGLDIIECRYLDAEGLNEISLHADCCVFGHECLNSRLFFWEFCCADWV